jgi:GAF domain-containing protein
VISVLKERRAKSESESTHRVKAELAAKAEQVRIELATNLADIGVPLITALGDVTSTTKLDEATTAITVLIDRSVGLGQTQLGRQTGTPSHIRATYYEFKGNNDKLLRNKTHTCAGVKQPRIEFTGGKNGTEQDKDVIRLAQGEEVRFIRDLDKEPLPYTVDSTNRSYKTLISVPVRAGNKSYGLLTADSDLAYSLTNVDRGFILIVAGTLAVGLAHLEAVRSATQS